MTDINSNAIKSKLMVIPLICIKGIAYNSLDQTKSVGLTEGTQVHLRLCPMRGLSGEEGVTAVTVAIISWSKHWAQGETAKLWRRRVGRFKERLGVGHKPLCFCWLRRTLSSLCGIACVFECCAAVSRAPVLRHLLIQTHNHVLSQLSKGTHTNGMCVSEHTTTV